MRIRKIKSKKFRINANGITLIALVITIIVLLILAGVTIATLTGENGILTRVNEAKENTEQAEENELRKLTQAEAATYLENHEYEDPSGEKITIPAKCAVSQVEGENTLEDEIVIIDKNGNEWVWIEVPKTTKVFPNVGINLDVDNITDEQCEAIYNDLATYTNAFRRSGYEDIFYSTEQHGFKDKTEYNIARNNMLRSVYKNEGFWIGRYEVGIENSYRNYGTDYATEHPIEEIPVIKANAYPYNYVRCNQAQILSKQLSIGEKTCSLMFGIQWDLVLKYLEENADWDTTINSASYYLKTVSGLWGNYSNETFDITSGKYSTDNGANYTTVNGTYLKPASSVLLTTGATERNCKMNIYDLAGNVAEWTLESSTNTGTSCARRGGNCYDDSSNAPASAHSNLSTSFNIYYVGFRPALY